MRRKDLERARQGISRRRTLQGLGALVGTAALGCGDDSTAAGGATETDGSSSGSSGGSTGDGSDGSTSGSTGASTDSGVDDTSGTTVEMGSSDDGTTGTADACEGSGGLTPAELLAEIDTIVIVMMENRSFDHYFGSAAFLEGWPCDGLTGTETNPDLSNTDVQVFLMNNFQPADPPHGWDSCHAQWNAGANDGFVREHEMEHSAVKHEVMGYHVRQHLPVLYALADNYALCDRWFASVMGPTWPNRFFLHCASSNGQKGNSPETSHPRIWNLLNDHGISCRNYYSDVAWAWGAFINPLLSWTDSLDEFFDAAQAGTLPQFVVIDPNFGILGGGGNDDHPSHDITLGQIFLGSIYEALAQSPQWNRCLLIITYDEHGGFYDHVPPPQVDDPRPEFQQLGFRVPSVVIGPHVRKGCVVSTQFDHVSPIATATVRWNLPPLAPRVTTSTDVSSCIDPNFLGNPQPPIRLPRMTVSIDKLLSRSHGTGQKELAAMIRDGVIELPAHRRHPNAGREQTLRLLAHAERLGLVELRP